MLIPNLWRCDTSTDDDTDTDTDIDTGADSAIDAGNNTGGYRRMDIHHDMNYILSYPILSHSITMPYPILSHHTSSYHIISHIKSHIQTSLPNHESTSSFTIHSPSIHHPSPYHII